MAQENVKIVRFDWAMKSLLRDKANFDVLEGFLHSLLGEPITIEEIVESESNVESDAGRYNCVDLLAKDKDGRRLIIEIQNERETDYLERMLFGTSKLVVESIDKGQKYGDIPKVISIHILYFNLGHGNDYVFAGTTILKGVHTDEPLEVSEHFIDEAGRRKMRLRDVFPEYYVINVERFNKVDDEDLEMLDQWMYLFQQSEVRGDFDAPGMETARRKLDYLKMNDSERRRYDKFIDSIVQETDVIETARKEGLEEGLEKGLEEGHEKGLEEGREKGLEEGIVLVAQKMIVAGKSDQEIADLTGLAVLVIKDLRKEI